MDFHSLTRRELQSLCKLNKIPANITNVAMADALQSLDIVEGIEKFLNVSHSETASNLVESAENIELLSPKAPQTRCRTSTRQKVKKTETENLPPTAARTTRRAAKQLAGGVKDVLKTPAISSTTRKAPSSSSCRIVNNQLNECHQRSLVDQKMESVPSSSATVVTNSQKKEATASTITLKQEGTLQEMKTYSRQSTRLTEKKSEETRVKKDSEKAVKIKSFLEEVNVASEENVSTVESGAQVEDICNAFEKLDVMLAVEKIDHCPVLETVVDEESAHKSEEEIKDMGEKDSSEAENDQVSPCEEENLEQKLDLEDEKFDANEVKDHNLVMVQEEQSDSLFDNNAGVESGSSTMVSEMIPDNTECPIESLNSDIENNFGEADEIATKDMKQGSENTVDETIDVIPSVDNDSFVIEEAQVFKRDSDEKDQFSVLSVPCLPIEGNPTSLTPMKKPTPFKNMSTVSNDKENIDSGRKLPTVFVDDGKKSKKEKDESERLRSLNEISMRQLRKQVKAMTLKSLNSNEDKETITSRPALQAICENKLVGGET